MAQYTVFFSAFLLTSLAMSIIILINLALGAVFPRYFSAKMRYAVWIVILAGLIIPVRPMVGGGLVSVPVPAETQIWHGASGNQQNQPADELFSAGAPAGRVVSTALLAGLVWGIAAIFIFSYHIWRYVCFSRLIQRWSEPIEDEAVLSVLRAVQTEKGLRDKKIALVKCGFISSSMLTGFFRPVILLPEKHFETDELELIFRHELIHYKRRDLVVKLLSVIAVSMHWFNPAVYWMCSAMQTDGEASCDEAVLLEVGHENRHFYAEVIIGMVGGKNTAGVLLSTCFYGGKNGMKKRLDTIMNASPKIKTPAAFAMAAIAALTLFSGSVFALTPYALTQVVQRREPVGSVEPRISMARAEDIAMARVGGGLVTKVEFRRQAGRLIYDIVIRYSGWGYEVVVDAETGSILSFETDNW